nr:response regulator [Gemmatimonadaceae bacterium]
ELPPDSHLRADMREIGKAGERAAALTRQLLSFSKGQLVTTQVLDLNDVVRGTELLWRRTIPEEISLDVDLHESHCLVEADRSELEQVLMNLVLNARDAVSGAGTIAIETRCLEGDELPDGMREGTSIGVMLTVRDDGCGMDEETIARMFEPFFTTKEHSRGTGLGLATVYGIVTSAGGVAWVESKPGAGTSFFVVLPSTTREITAELPIVPVGTSVEPLTATVLLAEDEGAVRASVKRALERRGLRVIEAKNGLDGLMLFREHAAEIDCIVTDVVMPELRGPDMVERIRARRPEMPVLFVSGYTDSALTSDEVGAPLTRFLPKPFSLDELCADVERLLLEARARQAARVLLQQGLRT